METSTKTWLLRFLAVLPILIGCLIISVVLWKHAHNEAFDINTVKLRHDVGWVNIQKREIQNEIDAAKVQRQQLSTEVDKLNRKLKSALATLSSVTRQKRDVNFIGDGASGGNTKMDCHSTAATGGGGAVYVHWGREDCPPTADIVYTGMAGGGSHAHNGAAVNMVCMTLNPVWAKYGNNAKYFTFMYGAEYEVHDKDFPLGHDKAQKLNEHDVPCAVCRSSTRTSAIMIPGTTKCTTGWNMEYWGYLMAGYHTHPASTEYNCINANPDANEVGTLNDNGRLLYRVKAKCGSLHCPPYIDMREVTCVVCTK